MANFTYTISKLDAAISNIIGADIFDALRSGSTARPELLKMACATAFVYGKGDCDDHLILRVAQTDLDRNGEFTGSL